MNERERREVAASLDAGEELLPFLPRLLADLEGLGCNRGAILMLLRSVALPAGSTLLDLGCGKGAVALGAARQLGLRAWGVDLFEPFVDEARRRSEELGVAARCRFEVKDLRQALAEARDLDVVVYASLGVLGSLEEFVRAIRPALRVGGYMIIDDGFLARASELQEPGYEHYRTHRRTVESLTAWGDELVEEARIPLDRVREENRRMTELIRRRVAELARLHPEATELLTSYVERQERECRTLERELVHAVWLLRRSSRLVE